MSDLQKLGDALFRTYEHNALVRAGLKFTGPAGAAIDTILLARLHSIHEKQRQEFFERLPSVELTEEMMNNDEFIHAFMATAEAVSKTRNSEKIHRFAKIFTYYYLQPGKKSTTVEENDDYEEILAVLDDLSEREYMVLIALHLLESSSNLSASNKLNPLQTANVFWDQFLDEVERNLLIPKDEIPGVLARLNRTGLYKTFTGGFFDYTGDQGCLTPNFKKFIAALNAKDGEYHPSGEVSSD